MSGIIGAVAFHGEGGRGVGYSVMLRGYNLIAPRAFSLANVGTALGSSTVSAENDLFNASVGPVTNAIPPFSGSDQAITSGTMTVCGGLGATIVSAAGDDFNDFEGTSSPLCALAQ